MIPFVSVCLFCLVSGEDHRKPNIILIVADDLGWGDVPWHDESIQAPRIKELAENGLILNQSYVQQVCTPSRAALLTGMYPYHLGRQHRALKPLRAGGIPTSFTLLPEMLKQQGYKTHMIGKWHLGYCAWEYTPTRRGFDSFYGTYLGVLDHWTHTRDKYNGYDFRKNEELLFNASGIYSTDLYTQETVSLISSRNKSDPFFLYLPYQALHAPLQVPKSYIDNIPSFVTDVDRRIYLAMLASIDKSVGRIVDSLKVTGQIGVNSNSFQISNHFSEQYDNTLLIFTTDNGASASHSGSNYPLR